MQETNHAYRYPYVLPLLLALVCVFLELAGQRQALQFDRAAVDAGNFSLLLSCNVVHLGVNHLILNIGGLALIYFLLWSNFATWEWLLIIVFSSLGVGIGVWLWSPELHWYVGLSGTLHGLMLAGAIADVRRYPISSSVLIVLIVGKLVWEQLHGALPSSEVITGGRVAVDSHLYGAIAGAFTAALLLGIRYLVRARP